MSPILVTFLGTGSAFTLSNYHTSFLIEDGTPEGSLLFDAGGDIRHSLAASSLSYKDVKNIYISHCHGDHCHGLEYLAFASFYDPNCPKPSLWVTHEVYSELFDILMPSLRYQVNKTAEISDYFDVHFVNGPFKVGSMQFLPVPLTHFEWGPGQPYITVGLQLYTHPVKILFTGDCDWEHNSTKLSELYESVDYVIQDCETLAGIRSGLHCHYEDLKRLPLDQKKKMFLVHYQDNVNTAWDLMSRDEGFQGFVQPGYRIGFNASSFDYYFDN